MTPSIQILRADFTNTQHLVDLQRMLIAYSADLMGGGQPLAESTAERSIALLASKPYTISFLAYEGDTAVGFANCFETIATFAALTALNIHDIAVVPTHRRRGIAAQLLHAIEDYANGAGMYKLTLEVLQGNTPALQAYQNFGFAFYQLDPSMGSAQFMQKILTP